MYIHEQNLKIHWTSTVSNGGVLLTFKQVPFGHTLCLQLYVTVDLHYNSAPNPVVAREASYYVATTVKSETCPKLLSSSVLYKSTHLEAITVESDVETSN